MNDLNAAITARLKNDATLTALGSTGVYKDEAPQSTASVPIVPPYIIYGKQGGNWDPAHDSGTIRDPRYYIKAVDKSTSSVRAGSMDERAAAVMHGERLLTNSGTFLCLRTGDMPDFREVVDGVTFQHIGGLYRFSPG